MSQSKNPSLWYRFLHPFPLTTSQLSTPLDKSAFAGVKDTKENDLKFETILIEEFKFRGDSIKLVSSEFTSTLNLYFIFLGISVTGFGIIYQLSGGRAKYSQIVVALALLALGIISALVCVSVMTIIHSIVRDKACMNLIRKYYIEHLQDQRPDISIVFLISFNNFDYNQYHSIIYSIFAFVDSLCFAGAAFVFTELWLSINSVSLFPLLPLPSDLRPYIVAVVVGIILLLSQFVFFRITLYKYASEFD